MKGKNFLSSSELLLFNKTKILVNEYEKKQTKNGYCCAGIKKTTDSENLLDLKKGKLFKKNSCNRKKGRPGNVTKMCPKKKEKSSCNKGKCCNKCYNYCGDKSCNKNNCEPSKKKKTSLPTHKSKKKNARRPSIIHGKMHNSGIPIVFQSNSLNN